LIQGDGETQPDSDGIGPEKETMRLMDPPVEDLLLLLRPYALEFEQEI
jgi:hypothetical protein